MQREIWYEYNKGRIDLRRFREWDWYDYKVVGQEVWKSLTTIIDKKTHEKVWEFGVSTTPMEEFGKDHWK